jgi:hypothetical protein
MTIGRKFTVDRRGRGLGQRLQGTGVAAPAAAEKLPPTTPAPISRSSSANLGWSAGQPVSTPRLPAESLGIQRPFRAAVDKAL